METNKYVPRNRPSCNQTPYRDLGYGDPRVPPRRSSTPPKGAEVGTEVRIRRRVQESRVVQLCMMQSTAVYEVSAQGRVSSLLCKSRGVEEKT